jgi:hypothetical protein
MQLDGVLVSNEFGPQYAVPSQKRKGRDSKIGPRHETHWNSLVQVRH